MYERPLAETYVILFLYFVSPFSIASTLPGEERANLSAFCTFVRFVLCWICWLPLPLEGLRFVIAALPGIFSYLLIKCMIKQQTLLVTIKIPSTLVICPCPWAIYMYKISKSLIVFFFETAWLILTRLLFWPSVKGNLSICSNRSASFNKIAVISIYGKTNT